MAKNAQVMVEPQEPPTVPKPHISDIGQALQVSLLVQFHNIYYYLYVCSLVSDFLATVPVLLPGRVKLCVAPAPSPQLRLRGFNPHCQDWVGGGVADPLPSIYIFEDFYFF